MLKVLALVLLVVLTNGDEIFNRPCRTAAELGGVKVNFGYVAYTGNWYELERYDNRFVAGQDCNIAGYTVRPGEPMTYNVEYRAKYFGTGNRYTAPGTSRVSFPNDAILRAKLNTTMIPGGATDRSNYWILGTDYINYAFVVGCLDTAPNQSVENYWLLSRTETLNPAVAGRVDELRGRVLDRSRIRTTVQGPTCL